jgi:hypothetical protein
MSTLDLTFAAPGIAEQVLQCQPCEKLDSDPDYVLIIRSIETSFPQQTECPAQPQWRKDDLVADEVGTNNIPGAAATASILTN